MKPFRVTLLVLALAATGVTADAQTNAPPAAGPPGKDHAGSMPMHGPMGDMMTHMRSQPAQQPTAAGQAAFGTIQEIVAMLQADPHTDWSKVNIDALRQHLIDMDEVTLHAVTRNEPVDGGLRVRVTGSGRTLEAIQRMVPDHAREIDGMFGWTVRATPVPDGVELTVITAKAADVQQIRALGFMGIMVQGGHHPIHHKAMASGEMTHSH